MFITQFQKDVRDIRRLEHILGVLAKYGFGYIIDKLHLPILVAKPSFDEDFYHLPLEVRLRRILEELGPTFIKLGQMLSLHPEVISYNFCKEFENYKIKYFPWIMKRSGPLLNQSIRGLSKKFLKSFPTKVQPLLLWLRSTGFGWERRS